MKVAVFDTYVDRPDGRKMHFDVLVADSKKNDIDTILEYARHYLASKGVPSENLLSRECNFCHMQEAPPIVEQSIIEQGYYLIELENCS
jgi:hypothetical protein